MRRILDQARAAAADENPRALVIEYPLDRLEERHMMGWQVLDGVQSGELLRERLQEKPHP